MTKPNFSLFSSLGCPSGNASSVRGTWLAVQTPAALTEAWLAVNELRTCLECMSFLQEEQSSKLPRLQVRGPGPALLREPEMGRGDRRGRSFVWNQNRMVPSEIAYRAGGEEVILFPTEGERKNSDSETISVLQLMFYNSIAHCQGFYSTKWVHACLQGPLS